MNSADIRKKFLDFFQSKQHHIVPSAPIVVKNDPTLLFTNAGMNQFKDYFLGNRPAPWSRVVDTQKCLRVSGKHNDLEEVGVDTYHHTMFEMLGNWSFGDYFKKEAIEWSWELLTGVYGLDKDRLYVTIFEGDAGEHIEKDEEALAEWKKWIAEDRIITGNKKDNFWEMGDTGPCGPCSEIHVDCRSDEERKKINGKDLVNKDHPQVIEIWNNVFIQFNRSKDGSLEPLPAKHVDTGMGFERLVRVLQNKQSNYDTDVFSGTIAATEKLTHKKYGAGAGRPDVAFRVIADHIRAISFTIADGQLPSNTGAGYVIRRILRRAVRYYFSYLDHKSPLLYQLLPLLATQFREVFPELDKQQDFISKVIREEEEAFLRTLDTGIRRFENYIASAEKGSTLMAGDFAFELNDTYGFPLDLTQLMAVEAGWQVDTAGFAKKLGEQKKRSRAAGAMDLEDWTVLDPHAITEFVGYDSLEVRTKVVKYRKVTIRGKEGYQLVLAATPFYAESGGQAGDTGVLDFEGTTIEVTDTKKENDLVVQFTDSLPPNIGTTVVATVNLSQRRETAVHHSATHLLHSALRKVLGTHVAQRGSLVNRDELRFDFSHFAKMTAEETEAVEKMVNEKIRENIPVVIREMNKEEAMASGAMALFGEKYGDRVRVVTIDPHYSTELCGGTHVARTGELGFFRITHEAAVAAGVRRIEAVSGRAGEDHLRNAFAQLEQTRTRLRNPKDMVTAIDTLLEENAELRKKLESLEARQLLATKSELLAKQEKLGDIQFIGAVIQAQQADDLKKLCFLLKADMQRYVVVLAASIDGKAHVAVLLDESVAAAKGLEAPAIIRQQVAPLIKGGGGGQKTLATAGGQETGQLPQVIQSIRQLIS